MLMIATAPRGGRVANQIPAEILEDVALNEAIKIVYSPVIILTCSYLRTITLRYIRQYGM